MAACVALLTHINAGLKMKTGLYKFEVSGERRRRGEWEWIGDYRCSAADSLTCYCVSSTQINNGSHFVGVSLFCNSHSLPEEESFSSRAHVDWEHRGIFIDIISCFVLWADASERRFIENIIPAPDSLPHALICETSLTAAVCSRTPENSTSPTSALTSTTPRATWTPTAPFLSAWRRTSPSSWPPSASPAHSPPPWSPWRAASRSPTSRYISCNSSWHCYDHPMFSTSHYNILLHV